MDFELIKSLVTPADTRIVLFVMDGLGGHPQQPRGPTELEAARTPNLDRLAAEGVCGLHMPIGSGLTPGSGPAHLALFGYDPVRYEVGRGVLSALGIGFDLQPRDVAARGNFCTADDQGRVVDRRAGRISTETGAALCEKLRQVRLPDLEVFVEPVKEYRMLLVLRGEGLSGEVSDTDPQDVGVSPLHPEPLSPEAEKTARAAALFLEQAGKVLSAEHPANMVLLRGFAQRPDWPQMGDVFGLRAAAIAGYPMYRGVSSLVGMDVLDTGAALEEELATLEKHWGAYDLFFVHYKLTDSAGEDGDFGRKVALIEQVDAQIPRLLNLEPDVLIVTGDHSTPAVLRSHSWHPVPVLLWSRGCRPDLVTAFGERPCIAGGLGPRLPAVDLLPLALANAGRLNKFGA